MTEAGIYNNPAIGNGSNTEQPKEPPYVINFFGATSFGANLTDIRNKLAELVGNRNFLSPSSGIGVRPHKPFDTLSAKYKVNARKIILDSDGRDIIAHGSSSGGLEVIHQIEALLDAGCSNRNIKILLTNVPGIESHGIATVKNNGFLALGRFITRWAKMFRQRYALEQDITYPLPEGYYSNDNSGQDHDKQETENRRFMVIQDTPIDRSVRRDEFRTYIVSRLTNKDEHDKYLDQLDVIDKEINEALLVDDDKKRTKILRELKKKRGDLIKPFIEEYFRDGRNDPNDTKKYMQDYDEIRKGLADKSTTLLWSIAISLALVFGPTGFLATIVKGYKSKLEKLNKLAKARNVNLTLSFGFMENDLIVPPQDIDQILDHFKDLEEQGIPLIWAGLFESMAHMTLGQESQMLIEMIKRIE